MYQVCFLWVVFTVAFSLRTLNQHISCTQQGLDDCTIRKCSEPLKVETQGAPTGPVWGSALMGVVLDREQFIPILNVSWKIPATGIILVLKGSQIFVRDEKSNVTACWEYSYNLTRVLKPNSDLWMFTLDGLVVEPEHTYEVSVYNIPEDIVRDYRIVKKIAIPGCHDKIMKHSQTCRENGSLWVPGMSTLASLDRIQKLLFIVVSFNTSEYSERYAVSLKSPGVFSSETVLKENQTSVNVTFSLRAPHCKIVIKIQPFFKQCNKDCWSAEQPFDYCFFYTRTLIAKMVFGCAVAGACMVYVLWRTCPTCSRPVSQESESLPQSADSGAPECTQMAKQKRLLIIYSLDHPLYKNIVLKLCSFLMAKCGTEVVLDMLDSTRLGMVGGLQWLEWHKQQIEKSSDKILILCSRGVQAKWSAMCTGKEVQLREDVHSTVGDMLVPALCIMVPEFVKSPTFEKYIVAYFDGVSTEDDVPSPFNMTVRYKLMKQFEELFFRILGGEKYEIGRVNRIKGLSEDDYHLCPTGGALRKAIEDFHAYQIEHPHWFEEELIENAEMDIESDFVSLSQNEARQIVNNLAPEATTLLISEQREHLSLKM